MIIKGSETTSKKVGPMEIRSYKINSDFSLALINISGDHGKLKCLKEDRIYFIISGKGKFIINEKESLVSKNDLIFIPKNTPYNIIGKMKYTVLSSPEFNSKHDVFL